MRQIIDKWLIQRTTIDATIEHSVLRICEVVNGYLNSNSILLTFYLILNNRIPFNYLLKTLNFWGPQSKPSHRLFAMGRAEAGVALSIKQSGIVRRNLLAEREAYLAPLSRIS